MSALLPPGPIVTVATSAPPRQAPTAISPFFLAGITSQGPTAATPVNSLAQYIALFGPRVSQGLVYDALDAFFHEGGTQAYVARVIGPTPVYATCNLLDSSAATSLVVTAKYYGTYANGYQIVVTGGGNGVPFTITVEDANSNVLETSGTLATQAAAVTYGAASLYVNVVLGGSSNNPNAQTRTLASGTDDYTDATDTQWLNAINNFPASLGPGQVAMPGRTTGTAHANLIAHAAANNRRALLDYTDTASRSTLVTAANTDTLVANSMYAAAFAPWVTIPGVTSGTTRSVPPSAVVAGIIARNDNAGVSPNQPSAGSGVAPTGAGYGQSLYAIGLSQTPWSATSNGDQFQLNNAGVNVILPVNGINTIYGYRTLAPASVPADWLLLSNSRLVMAIYAKAYAIGQGMTFDQIDGNGFLFANFNAELTAMLMPYYNQGALYGATPAAAFSVNTGPNVNTPTTIAALQLCAILLLSLSPFAEQVPIQIVTTTLTGGAN